MDRTDQKVVKVVNLKRFRPETHLQSKRKFKFQAKVRESFNKNNETHILSSNVCLNTNSSQIRENHEKDSLVFQENERIQVVTNEKNDSDVQTHSNIIKSQKDGLTGKVKFKKCTHTQVELNRLIEHCDETLVQVGDTFDSRDTFRDYVYHKAKRWFYYYVCRNSKKNNMEYTCLCTAYNVKPRDIIIRQQKQRTTACPCKIRLTTDESTKKIIVYYVCNHHDHDLSEEAFHEYPHAKHLPHRVKEEFLDLAYLGVDVHLIQKYIKSLVGVTIKNKTINSYIYKFKRKMIQRSLTADRKNFLYHLILSIRTTYDTSFNTTVDEKLAELCKVQPGKHINKRPPKREKKSRQNFNSPCKEIVSKNEEFIHPDSESNYSFLDQVLGTDLDMDNAEVIIRYVNEKGILCDENGIPIRNSTAIMHFINNYEPITPVGNFEEEYLQEREDYTVFGELEETIREEMYATDIVSMPEVNPLLERPNMTYETDPNDEFAEESVSINDDIAQELFVQTTEDKNSSDQDNADDDLNIVLSNTEERLSPTLENPGLYAEMDNFQKYYFVDHRYIKYDDEKHRQEIQSEDVGKITPDSNKLDNIDIPPNLVVDGCLGSVFRHCSGHDDLTPLRDPYAILAGATFKAHSQFLDYINGHASTWCFYYSLQESGKSPEYYVYKCVYGKQRLAKNAYRSQGLRKRSTLKKTQCPCQIRLRRLEIAPSLLTAVYSCNHHNHALDREHFEALPHSRRLPPHMKEEIKDMLCLGVSYDVLRKHILAETGHKIYEKYFHNVRVKMRRNKDYRNFTDETLEVLSKKIDELYALYGVKSKAKIKTDRCKTRKRKNESPSLKLDRATQVLDQPNTLSIEYLDDDYAEEVCIAQEDSCFSDISAPNKRSRLETCLQDLSSHEDTPLDVKKLQESARIETS